MFGRLLYLSAKNQINLCEIFKYPLLSEKACFASPVGSIRDSPKSKVQSFLKEQVNSHPPVDASAVVVDGMFFVRPNSARFTTYQTFATNTLKEVLKMTSKRADLMFDVYVSPFIKHIQRKGRGDDDTFEAFFYWRQTKN